MSIMFKFRTENRDEIEGYCRMGVYQLIVAVTRFWKIEESHNPGSIANLAKKQAGEEQEFHEAAEKYSVDMDTVWSWKINGKTDEISVDKHVLNDDYLHYIDEAADFINCTVCAVIDGSMKQSLAETKLLGIFASFSALSCISTVTDMKNFRYAIEAAAVSKGKVTSLRCHWMNGVKEVLE